jgi:hypothetical protein
VKQYLLSIEQPDGPPPSPDILSTVMRKLDVMNADLKAEGGWVFAGGLHPPSAATVVRSADASVLYTDGPYTEGKEHVGGILIISVPDLDRALHWAGRLAEATTLPIEVRPFQDGPNSGP